MALTDAQVDAIFMADTKELGCHWLEGEAYPYHRCGAKVDDLTQAYCKDHHSKAYIKNSALRNRRKAKFIEAEVREAEMAALIADQEADVDVVDVAEPLTVEIG